MTVTVFTRKPFSAYATSSEALVNYLDVDAKLQYVLPGNKNKEFTEIFPENNRFTPAVYDKKSGFVLNQAVAVNRYLVSIAKDKKGLLGKNKEEEYLTLQWSNRADGDVFQKIMGPFFASFTAPDAVEKIQAVFKEGAGPARGIEIFEEHLSKNTYLVGEQLTLADIEAAGLFYFPLKSLVDAKWQQAHPAIMRWASTILNGPAYAKKFGGKFVPSKDGDIEGAIKDAKVVVGILPMESEKKPAADKPKQPQQQPQQADAKPKHPLALLGNPSKPLDALKRAYSNQDTRTECLPWFWNEFYNDEEWSLWKVDYKYNDELTLTFMSNNLIGGFFNRLSASVKYMFGAAIVFGENNDNGIRGAFIIRGHDFMPAFDVAPDWESFNFTRLDAKNPKDREELDDLWAWDKPILYNGKERPIVDGKVLK